MANKTLFRTTRTSTLAANTVNAAGGVAYEKSARHVLAQIAATNCFNGTFYADAEKNLQLAKDAALNLKDDPRFIAKTAIYTRTKGNMKDMPAFLLAMLAGMDTKLFQQIFPLVVDNGKMLQTFCQIARSGATGRTFRFGSGTCRRAIGKFLNGRTPRQLLKDSIGGDFPLRDIIAMAHPKPIDEDHRVLFGHLRGREVAIDSLPSPVREYELYKKACLTGEKQGIQIPDVDFRLLDSLGLEQAEWMQIAMKASWTMTRMNLNTFARHGVFEDKTLVDIVAARLRDKNEVLSARAFPYQMMSAYIATQSNDKVPVKVREALQDAMEIAIENVPTFEGDIYICVDTSGSMSSAITGMRKGSTSAVSCVQVAGLFASAVYRKNPQAKVYTFSDTARRVELNPRDTVITNTQKMAHAGGGTNCSAALAGLNAQAVKGDAVLYVSDYESWLDNGRYGENVGMMSEWQKFQHRNPDAKLVCIDLTPTNYSQVKERRNVLQVGGFGDQVWEVIRSFIEHGHGSVNHWVDIIEQVEL
jgi:60 kDa SS-A/Ro ribonucleoprotein